MSDRYLWDKTGEVDPEVEELEQLLSTFRYQSRTIEIPASVTKGRRFFLPITIAAAAALLMLGLGIWSNFNRPGPVERAAVTSPSKTDATGSAPTSDNTAAAITDSTEHSPAKPETARMARTIARPSHRVKEAKFTAAERREAKNAKEQLVIGLRLASSKLNLAQKRTQGIQSTSPIRYQHKIG